MHCIGRFFLRLGGDGAMSNADQGLDDVGLPPISRMGGFNFIQGAG